MADEQESGSHEPLLGEGDVEAQEEYANVTYASIIRNFVLMGWTAFGGPQAHIGMFETTFIQKHRWMSSSVFMELFALSSCLPGPTSTQVSFALGAVKRGIPGGLLGGALFQYPGLMIMTIVGIGIADFLKRPTWWSIAAVDGLAAVGVALVAVAAKGLVAKAAKGPLTSTLLLLSAVLSFIYNGYNFPWLFPALIVASGLITLAYHSARKTDMAMRASSSSEGIESFGLNHTAGIVLLVIWGVVLAAAIIVRAMTSYSKDVHLQPLHWFESFYRVGSLIYGGGQVVLPMLQDETTETHCTVDVHGARHCSEVGWITTAQFKAGFALIQAMPGPMFNFSAYLGAVIAINAGWNPLIGVAACWLGLFGPGIMLLYGLLPFWGQFRASNIYRRALPGLNAAAVGLVVMALFDMYNKFTMTSVFPKASVGIGMIGFCLVDAIKAPAPIVVLLGGGLGVAAGALHLP